MQGVIKASDEHLSPMEPNETIRVRQRGLSPHTSGPRRTTLTNLVWETSAYLSEGALHPTQEVIVAGSDAVSAVDVVDFKSELLHLLEVVVQGKDLGKHRVQVALYDFRPVQLGRKHRCGFCEPRSTSPYKCKDKYYVALWSMNFCVILSLQKKSTHSSIY